MISNTYRHISFVSKGNIRSNSTCGCDDAPNDCTELHRCTSPRCRSSSSIPEDRYEFSSTGTPWRHPNPESFRDKTAQFGLETCKSLLRDSEPFAGEGETKKRTLIGLHHTAFVPVDLYLEFLLKENTDTRHYTFSSASGLHQDDDVIGIPCEPMPSFLQFFIEIIQKDIAQKRRQWPALRHTFGRLVQPSVYDNTGSEVSAYQTKNAFVADSPRRLSGFIRMSWLIPKAFGT